MAAEVLGRDEYQVVDFHSYGEMGSILELVACIAAEIGYMPTHSQRRQRTQHATGVEFPGVIGIIQVAMRGKIVVGDHTHSPVLSFCFACQVTLHGPIPPPIASTQYVWDALRRPEHPYIQLLDREHGGTSEKRPDPLPEYSGWRRALPGPAKRQTRSGQATDPRSEERRVG